MSEYPPIILRPSSKLPRFCSDAELFIVCWSFKQLAVIASILKSVGGLVDKCEHFKREYNKGKQKTLKLAC